MNIFNSNFNNYKKKKLNTTTLLFIIFFFGCVLRILNIGSEDLWYDEILTFSLISDQINLDESINLSNKLDGTPILFTLIFRLLFKILPNDIILIKLILVFFSILSIAITGYIIWLLKKNKSFIFGIFLVSFNVYLIDYCSELRAYTFIYFFSSLSILYFIKVLEQTSKKNLIFFNFFTIVNSFLHPFNLIIFFSFVFFLIVQYLKKKKYNKKIILSLIVILNLSLIYYTLYLYSNSAIKGDSWITNFDIHFYYNYFFSHFFGSKLMGVIFLSFFIYLIYKNYFLIKQNYYLFFILLFILSYILPLTFNYLFKPILISRYIIFVLLPIIILFSIFTFDLKNLVIKKIIISLSVIFIVVNSFLENPIKKLYNETYGKKPEFTKAIHLISDSNYNDFLIKFSNNGLKNYEADVVKIFDIYINHLSQKKKLKNNLVEKKMIKTKDKIWILCDPLMNSFDCSLKFDFNYNVLKDINLYRLNLKFIEIK